MKKTIISSMAAVATLVLLYAFDRPIADVFKVDAANSTIAWVGQNVAGGKHTGTIGISKGSLTFDGNSLVGGSFTANVASIDVTDLTGDRATRLSNHLKSEDFFDAAKFPEATFVVTKVDGGGADVTITGDLTIKGIKKSVVFPATVHKTGDRVHAVAKGVTIDRTQFDVKYRSGNFFSGLGDRAILDEFQLDIELTAVR